MYGKKRTKKRERLDRRRQQNKRERERRKDSKEEKIITKTVCIILAKKDGCGKEVKIRKRG